MKNTIKIAILSLVFSGLNAFGEEALKSNHGDLFKGHSIKKLNVGASDMVLVQAFIKNNLMLSSDHDYLGISQKENLISLYMDYEKAPNEIKFALTNSSYIRGEKKVSELLHKSFDWKRKKGRVIVSLDD